MAQREWSPLSPQIQVTDQTGRKWAGVPGFSNEITRQSNRRPLSKRVSLVPVIGKKPPQHPDYQKNCYKQSFFQASYDGGCEYKDAMDSAGDPIFIPHPNEPPDSANVRKRMSVVRNYCASLINKFGSYIFSQPIIRSTDSRFVEWAEDVDGLGTPLCEFMESVSDKARTLGMWGIIFDTTKEDDSQTQATAAALGNRPILSDLHPGRIINWSPDRTELLIQHDVGEFGEVWLWSQTSIAKFGLDEKGKIAGIGEVVNHGYPRMPIVLCSGLNDYRSLIKDVSEIQKRLFHLDSVLIEELIRQTFTSFLLVGIDAKELDNVSPFAISGRKFTCINRPKTEVEAIPIGSNVSQAQSLRDSIRSDEIEIFRTMGLRVPDEVSNHPESGKAIKLREGEASNMAATLANNTESAEKDITRLYNFATQSSIESAQYPDSFDADDLQELLADTILVLTNEFGKKLKSAQTVKYIQQAYREAPIELRVELENEAKAMAEEVEEAPMTLPGQPVLPVPPAEENENENENENDKDEEAKVE